MEVRLAVEGAPGGGECEDYAFSIGGLVGVLDGATIPAGVESGCVHSTAWYVRALAGRLAAAYVGLAAAAPLASLLDVAISTVREDHGGTCDLDHPGTPAATVCLVRAAGERLDYLVLCDSPLALDFGERVDVVNDERFSIVAADIRARALVRGGVGTDAQAERQHWSALQRQERVNRPGSYWIAAADPRAAREAVVGSVPLVGEGGVRRAALLTDGASCIVDRFGAMDWPELLTVLTNEGPAELIRQVRRAERADGAGLAQPRYKRHDDAAAAVCLFNQEG